jgi:glycosyltransferase involved in cell wall biosynthesis
MLSRERLSIEQADLLAAPSHIMLEGLINQGLRIPAKHAVLPKPLIPLREWENEESKVPTVLFVGRLDIGKGIGFLPEIIQQVKLQVPDVRFEIAGGDTYARGLGSCKSWLERKLRTVSKHVRFLGQLDRRDINEAYRKSWVVIVPSKWDTSPTAVLEAMQREKAIVASPYGGMSEYLQGTENRIEDPKNPQFAEAVVYFLKDEVSRISAGRKGKEKSIREYSPEVCANRYIEFLNRSIL